MDTKNESHVKCVFCTGEYIHTVENKFGRQCEISIKDGVLSIVCCYDDYDWFDENINYCPKCGRKFKK